MIFLIIITLIAVPFAIFMLKQPEEANFLFDRWRYKEDPHLSETGIKETKLRAYMGIGLIAIMWIVFFLETARTG